MMRYGQFLDWKPSQLAAAAFLLSINLNLSSVGPSVGLKALRGNQVQQLIQGTLPVNVMAELAGVCSPYNAASSSHSLTSQNRLGRGPLGIWTSKVAELTGLNTSDFASAYTACMNHLDKHQFKGQL